MSEPPKLDRFLTYRLHRVARLSDRETGPAYVAECDLNIAEARCLAAIGSFEPLSLNDLARAANQDKGHASRSAQALVAAARAKAGGLNYASGGSGSARESPTGGAIRRPSRPSSRAPDPRPPHG